MTPRWKELSNLAGYILLFGIIAYNLYSGTGILASLFRGGVAFLIFSIVNILVTNVMVKLISDYEFRRLKELSAREEKEELSDTEGDRGVPNEAGGR